MNQAVTGVFICCLCFCELAGQQLPRFNNVKPVAGEIEIEFSGNAGASPTLEVSSDLKSWQSVATFAPDGAAKKHVDSSAPRASFRYYRLAEHAETNRITGDHIQTELGDVIVHPIVHASLLLSWNGKIIFNDPDDRSTSYRTRYNGLPKGHLILVSHSHGDHFDSAMISTLLAPEGKIIAPRNVYNNLSTALKASTIILTNGGTTSVFDINVEAVPAYNGNHPRGEGNGYVVNLGEKRFFFSGDTGNIPEMRALPSIDVAFVCINQPFTMTVNDATNAITAFLPRVFYPYHYQNQDGTQGNAALFKQRLNKDLPVEVRLRAWY